MANLFARSVLFLSSYIPLWIIFAIITYRAHTYVSAGFALVALGSLILTFLYLRSAQSLHGLEIPVSAIRRQDSETMSYIASYVIPFAATALDDVKQVTALAVFLMVLWLVYVNSSMIHINPTLTIIGYRLYEIEDAKGNPLFLLSRRRVQKGETVKAVDIAEGIFVEKN